MLLLATRPRLIILVHQNGEPPSRATSTMESSSPPLGLGSHRVQERSFPGAVSMTGPSSPGWV
ncbi:hypothetical protein PVAP13_5KG196507 [Panicum virgatum]|uniref:Uncharacterized protein n=1 Tax=Panicum virgatum TaxID=38727 RepID=A0A8T0SFA0_PANVG|nr:hypothetical protein PVAP13_5KG196507 [Panicum virgatum]